MTCYGTIGDYLGEMRGHYAFEGACSFTFLVYVHEKKKKLTYTDLRMSVLGDFWLGPPPLLPSSSGGISRRTVLSDDTHTSIKLQYARPRFPWVQAMTNR